MKIDEIGRLCKWCKRDFKICADACMSEKDLIKPKRFVYSDRLDDLIQGFLNNDLQQSREEANNIITADWSGYDQLHEVSDLIAAAELIKSEIDRWIGARRNE